MPDVPKFGLGTEASETRRKRGSIAQAKLEQQILLKGSYNSMHDNNLEFKD